MDLPWWGHPGVAVASFSHTMSDTQLHANMIIGAAASSEPCAPLPHHRERGNGPAGAASSALSLGSFCPVALLTRRNSLRGTKQIEPRAEVVSRSTTSKQLGLITASVLPVCFDNLPHCEPLPGYVLPDAPVGSLEKYKRKEETLWPHLVLTHH